MFTSGLLGYEVTYVVTEVLEELVAYIFRWRFIMLITVRNVVLLSSSEHCHYAVGFVITFLSYS